MQRFNITITNILFIRIEIIIIAFHHEAKAKPFQVAIAEIEYNSPSKYFLTYKELSSPIAAPGVWLEVDNSKFFYIKLRYI